MDRSVEVPWQQQVSAEEKRFVLQVRSVNIIRAWVHTSCLVAYNLKYLAICGGDTGVMAIHQGVVRSLKVRTPNATPPLPPPRRHRSIAPFNRLLPDA